MAYCETFLSIPITPRLLFHRSDADAELYINRAPVGDRLCFASRLAGSVPKYLSWRISMGCSYLSDDSRGYRIDLFISKWL